jgi:cap3/cap4 methyltransferase
VKMKRGREGEEGAHSVDECFEPGRYFRYTAGEEPPIALELDTFPRALYRSRGAEAKSTIHWGQRKLLLSEMQLLTYFTEPKTPHWIVYVGAAPGTHTGFLMDLFAESGHTWELVDPSPFHTALQARVKTDPKLSLQLKYFDNEAAYDVFARRLIKANLHGLSRLYEIEMAHAGEVYKVKKAEEDSALSPDQRKAKEEYEKHIPFKVVAPFQLPVGLSLLVNVAAERTKTVFISDVRNREVDPDWREQCVTAEEKMQEAWTSIINPTVTMLKFRLPYRYISKYDETLRRQVQRPTTEPLMTSHLSGTIVLPIWTRPTSTECRLVVPAYAPYKLYNREHYEDALFFFNAILRESVYFDHTVEGHPHLDHRFDASAELALHKAFLKIYAPKCLLQEGGAGGHSPAAASSRQLTPEELQAFAVKLFDKITQEIGWSFEKAVASKNEFVLQKGSKAGFKITTERNLEEAQAKRNHQLWRKVLPAVGDHAAKPFFWRLWELSVPSDLKAPH